MLCRPYIQRRPWWSLLICLLIGGPVMAELPSSPTPTLPPFRPASTADLCRLPPPVGLQSSSDASAESLSQQLPPPPLDDSDPPPDDAGEDAIGIETDTEEDATDTEDDASPSDTELDDEDLLDSVAEPTAEGYAELSARIDAIDRVIEREVDALEEFRTSVLEAVSSAEAATAGDRETTFFDQAGFRFQTRDRRYELAIRGQIQTDARTYAQRNQDPVKDGFFLPRSRVYFAGKVTPAIEYQLSLQRGFNNLNVLNSYVRFRYGEDGRLSVGRFKTPYTYDFFTYTNWQLLSPERSLFNVNFGLNRMVGAMANGTVLEERLEYAVGIFDGPRNSFRDTNSAKDVVAFLNYKPWRLADGKNINIGGSVAYGYQDNPLRPAALRTSANASTNRLNEDTTYNRANVPFLEFNEGVREVGARNLWEIHTSMYLGPLTILAAWDSGYEGYARTINNESVRVPLEGYHVQVGYMLTGETIPGPVDKRPLRRFNPQCPSDGPGAWQVVGRYSFLNLGEEVFADDLADPDLWTRRVQMVDLGLNWYFNRFTSVTFNWQHAMFATPVAYNRVPDLHRDSDLFWWRLNLIF